MALDFAADLATMFSTSEFAQLATYTRQGYASAQIPVIFEKEYLVSEGVEGQGVGTFAPVATCKTADVPNAAEGDRLNPDGTNYYVLVAKPDGTGITVLILSKDPP